MKLKEQRIVGTNTIGYPQFRNFTGLPMDRYRFVKVQDVNKVKLWLKHRFTGRLSDRYLNTFQEPFFSRCDLLHFFNALSVGRTPWITTFETRLPRWGAIPEERLRHGMELMAGPACKKLIALSECAAKIQREHVERSAPDLASAILPKIMVLHPAQQVHTRKEGMHPLRGEIVIFTFVGADFFRKGGMEMLKVFHMVHQRGMRNWRLNIVSAMSIGDHATHSSAEDLHQAMALIARYPEHIHLHRSLPNQEVLALFKRSHIGLLPTWAETYGYSVLEAQACGCPVISTDIRALPEINSDEVGWLVRVPKDDHGFGLNRTVSDVPVFREQLTHGLSRVIDRILSDPSGIAGRSKAVLNRIGTEHAPSSRARILERIYDEALEEGSSE